ncbi:thioredoxin domain-containing protein [Solirubrobacter taibaiensis]|nr:thioredoxin domain-containing protein [Solirubrobacter taibaiensis]
MPPTIVDDRDFAREVLSHDAPVLVSVQARWCQPSRDLAPVITTLAKEYDGRAKVVVVDLKDGDPRTNRTCARYGVTRLPVVMLFDEGERKDFIGGMTSKESIAKMLDRRLEPMLAVGEHNFEAEVVRSKVPVLAFFRAAWCSASLEVQPVVEELGVQFRGRAKTVAIEFGGDNARLCAQWGIQRVPTIALFVNGQIQDQIFGAMKGGAKARGSVRSCVNLTSLENVGRMLEEFIV